MEIEEKGLLNWQLAKLEMFEKMKMSAFGDWYKLGRDNMFHLIVFFCIPSSPYTLTEQMVKVIQSET